MWISPYNTRVHIENGELISIFSKKTVGAAGGGLMHICQELGSVHLFTLMESIEAWLADRKSVLSLPTDNKIVIVISSCY